MILAGVGYERFSHTSHTYAYAYTTPTTTPDSAPYNTLAFKFLDYYGFLLKSLFWKITLPEEVCHSTYDKATF